MPRFTFEDIRKAQRLIDPVFTHTPQFDCEPLSEQLGCNIILKVETLNPLRSFKGRGADLLVQRANDKKLICASAGNFGQAMSFACRKKGIGLIVYAAVNANPFKLERIRKMGATVVRFGRDFDEAKDKARNVANEAGIRFVEDSLDVDTAIGAGTIGMELATLAPAPDVALVPLGNGALINGLGTAMKTLHPAVRIIAVQSQAAPAMIESWKKGTLITHERIDTIADGIGVRVPVREAVNDMAGIVDEGLLVKEESILKAMKLLYTHTGMAVEPSAAVGIAAIMEKPEIFAGKRIAVVITGSNLTAAQLDQWF